MKKQPLRKGNFDDIANFRPMILIQPPTEVERKEINEWIANHKARNAKRKKNTIASAASSNK